jgi:hypothetical protein
MYTQRRFLGVKRPIRLPKPDIEVRNARMMRPIELTTIYATCFSEIRQFDVASFLISSTTISNVPSG